MLGAGTRFNDEEAMKVSPGSHHDGHVHYTAAA